MLNLRYYGKLRRSKRLEVEGACEVKSREEKVMIPEIGN